MLEQLNNQRPPMQRSAGAHGGHAGGGGHEEHVDEWHHHATVEGEPQEEHAGQVNTGIIMKWFVVIVVFVVASIAFIMVYFNFYNTKMRSDSVETTMSSDYLGYRLKSQQNLSSHGQPATYAGLAGGKVQVPVANGMTKVIDKYKTGTVKLGAGLPEGHK